MSISDLFSCRCPVAFAYTNRKGESHRYVAVAKPLANGYVFAHIVWRDGAPRRHPMKVPFTELVGLHVAQAEDFA